MPTAIMRRRVSSDLFSAAFHIKYLDDATVAKMLKSTPPQSKNCRHLFRNLWDNGGLVELML